MLEKVLAPLLVFGEDFAQAIQLVVFFAISLIYGTVTEWTWRGQTVGKRLLRLRVVDARGLRLEPSQVIVSPAAASSTTARSKPVRRQNLRQISIVAFNPQPHIKSRGHIGRPGLVVSVLVGQQGRLVKVRPRLAYR